MVAELEQTCNQCSTLPQMGGDNVATGRGNHQRSQRQWPTEAELQKLDDDALIKLHTEWENELKEIEKEIVESTHEIEITEKTRDMLLLQIKEALVAEPVVVEKRKKDKGCGCECAIM